MKSRVVISFIFFLGFSWMILGASAYAQKFPKTLTVLYSNNLNGEIQPCPT